MFVVVLTLDVLFVSCSRSFGPHHENRDTAGQERFHTITTSYYRGAMGILLVYDVTNYKSFDNIGKWLRNISEHANDDVEKMILGNKCDCDDRRIISREKGEAVAAEHSVRFLETSAKANVNIDRAFLDLAEAILLKQSTARDGRDQDGNQTGDGRVFVSRGSESRGSSAIKCCTG